MKKTILIVLATLIIGACSSSNEPEKGEYYIYRSTPYESLKVYGEGGAEVPKSQWNARINDMYMMYKANEQMLKLAEFKLTGDSLITKLGTSLDVQEYTKRGDTICFVVNTWYETIIKPTAIQINNNTLEFHNSGIAYIHEDGSDTELSTDIGIIDKFMKEEGIQLVNLKKGEQIGIFLSKHHFKQ